MYRTVFAYFVGVLGEQSCEFPSKLLFQNLVSVHVHLNLLDLYACQPSQSKLNKVLVTSMCMYLIFFPILDPEKPELR